MHRSALPAVCREPCLSQTSWERHNPVGWGAQISHQMWVGCCIWGPCWNRWDLKFSTVIYAPHIELVNKRLRTGGRWMIIIIIAGILHGTLKLCQPNKILGKYFFVMNWNESNKSLILFTCFTSNILSVSLEEDPVYTKLNECILMNQGRDIWAWF